MENFRKKVSVCCCKNSQYVQLLKSSDIVNFYTGIENVDALNTIFDMMSPVVGKRWSGYKKNLLRKQLETLKGCLNTLVQLKSLVSKMKCYYV